MKQRYDMSNCKCKPWDRCSACRQQMAEDEKPIFPTWFKLVSLVIFSLLMWTFLPRFPVSPTGAIIVLLVCILYDLEVIASRVSNRTIKK